MMILCDHKGDWSGVHTRPDGEDFEVYRRAGQWYWRNCYTDREGFVIEYLGDETGPFTSSYEAFLDA